MALTQFRHLIKTISPSAKISNVRSIFNLMDGIIMRFCNAILNKFHMIILIH